MSEISRKQFIQLSITLLGGAVVAAACSDSNSTSSSSGGASSSGGSSSGGSSSSSSSGGSSSSSSGGQDAATDALVTDAGGDGSDGAVNACVANKTFTNAAGGGITSNHAHTVTIPLTDLIGNVAKQYTITLGGHTHTLDVTAAQFAMMRAGLTVNITSGLGGGHTHACALKC
jgi:hypothetical protein